MTTTPAAGGRTDHQQAATAPFPVVETLGMTSLPQLGVARQGDRFALCPSCRRHGVYLAVTHQVIRCRYCARHWRSAPVSKATVTLSGEARRALTTIPRWRASTGDRPRRSGISVLRVQELLEAFDGDQFRLFYQPIVRIGDDVLEVDGVEALVRWQHPSRGLLAPAEFLAHIEISGLELQLARWVVGTALAQQRSWEDAGWSGSMAINVSPSVLPRDELVTAVVDSLGRTGVDGARLTLEITEQATIEEPDAVGAAVAELRRFGVRFAYDDFGTGFANLSRLQQLQFDEVKIDRSFVTTLAKRWRNQEIVRFITHTSHRLGMLVTAEGVEDRHALGALRQLGIDRAQGYLFSRPRPGGSLPLRASGVSST